MLGVFIFGSSGFNNPVLPGQDCDDFVKEKYNESLESHPGNYNRANILYFGYFWACMDTEGESEAEVTVVAQ